MIELKKILVPTDFSETASVALRYGLEFADNFHGSLDILTVLEDPLIGAATPDHICPVPIVRHEMEQQAAECMGKVLTEVERTKYHAELVTLWGRPYFEIIRYAEEHDIDLIVIGTHGRGFVEHMLMGSVAEKVVRKATCPVLTVRRKEHDFIETHGHRREAAVP